MAIKLFTSDEAAEILGIKPATMRIWRMQGKGPHFKKVGHFVRYSEADLNVYLDSNSRISTSQKAPAHAAVA